jgi:hypothetical protein
MSIVPVPDDKGENGTFGGLIIGRGNQNTQRIISPCHFVHHKSHCTGI